MFGDQLKKILQLIKATGDRVIVYDPSAPDDSYVILDFNRYSDMINSGIPKKAVEVIAKEPIREIAKEPAKPAPKDLPTEVLEELSISEKKSLNIKEELIKDFVKDSVKSENLTEDDLTDTINREILMWKNRDNAPYLGEENKAKHPWQIPSQIKVKAQGVE